MTVQEAIKKEINECKRRIFRIKDFMENNKDANIDKCKDNIFVLETAIQALEEVEQYRALGTVEELTNQKHNLSVAYKCIEELQQPKTDWIPCAERLKMSESDFITHVLSIICDYAKVNNYEITNTVKAMGESLVTLTEIANFDKWKEGAEDESN